MKKISLLLLLFPLIGLSQDIIKLVGGTTLDVKILTNNPETISFERGDKGIPMFVVKRQIDEIKFQNGSVEKIAHPEIKLEEAQAKLLALINNEGYEKDGNKYQASFEGDKLRLVELDKKSRPTGKGKLFDIYKIIRYDEVSYRPEGFGYVNVWIPFLVDEKDNEWAKFKLVIRINDYEKAELLADAFKQVNKGLKNRR